MRKIPADQPLLFAPPAELSGEKRVPRTRSANKPAVTKVIPVKAVAAVPASVRVVMEKSGTDGQAWRMSGRHAVAYLRNAALAGELLATEPRHLAKAAMAVYYDRKGKAFAWQVRFDAERWDEVIARLG